MVEEKQLARIVVGIIVFIVINGVRGPEARRHVTMRRTEAGANVEDGSNNQKMVFQFDLHYTTRRTTTCFPVILCIDLPVSSSSHGFLRYATRMLGATMSEYPMRGHLYKQNNKCTNCRMAGVCSRCS